MLREMPNYPHLSLARQPRMCAAIAVASLWCQTQRLAARHRLAPFVALKGGRPTRSAELKNLMITALAAFRSTDQMPIPSDPPSASPATPSAAVAPRTSPKVDDAELLALLLAR